MLGRLDLLVDPGMTIPVAIQRLTGITDADVRGGPSPLEAVAMLADFADGAQLVAHGAGFDVGHCAALLPDAFARRPCLDTLDLARIVLPAAPSHSLPLLSRNLGLSHERPHRADSDAEATRALLILLLDAAERLPREVLGTIRAVLAPLDGPLRHFFTTLVTGHGDPLRPALAGMLRHRRPAPVPGPPRAEGDVDNRTIAGAGRAGQTLASAAADALGPSGVFGAREGFEHREAQVEMARAVGQTLDRGGRLLVEAGTGTGKSLGYLVPLALYTARTGRRAVVATHTVTLQEQLADRDLPHLAESLGLPVRGALLKGRRHYLSLRRWGRLVDRTLAHERRRPDLDTVRFILRITVWLAETRTGDRAELRLAGADGEVWRRVESTVDDCLGSACANWRDASCPMVSARRDALDADIVVTNQALLVADAERQGTVLGTFDAVVVDEAQHLEDTATRQLGSRLRARDVLTVLDRLGPADPDAEDELAVALAATRDAVARLLGDVRGYVSGALGADTPGNAVLALTDEQRARREFQPLLRAAQAAVARLERTAAALLAAGEGVATQQPLPAVGLLADTDELALAGSALADDALAIRRVLLEPRPDHVAWLELRAEQGELHEAPVRVDGALAERVFDRARASILTSATLSVAGAFDFIAGRTGLGGAATLRLDAPFDYLAQALTVVVDDLPPYDAADHDAALATLVADVARRLGGRTLVLFTGYAPLRAVHHLLGSRLEADRIAVLGQGIDGTRRQLLASFLAGPRTVLLGTATFWEGIDVPGDALRCVMIAKLPFPVPTDPLTAARGALLEDPFGGLALPTAVLRLKQGFGRLIRTNTDRGAVVLCDRRILSRAYGRTFLAALPEATVARSSRGSAAALVEAFVGAGTVPPGARIAGGGGGVDVDPDIYPEAVDDHGTGFPDDEGGA